MPAKKTVQKRQKKAAGKARSIPVPGKLETQKVKTKKPEFAKNEPSTAPVLPGAPVPEATTPTRRRTKPKVIKEHAVKHIKVLQTKGVAASIAVGRGYRKADAVVVRTAKRAVPESARQRLRENRAANDGNLAFYVPIAPKIIPRKVKVVVPAKVRRIRHAALPVALIAVLVFAMFPAGAAPGYGGAYRFGGSGNDEAQKVAIDSEGNSYTVGNFSGTVDFAEDWGGTGPQVLYADDFEAGNLGGWDTTTSVTASTEQSVSGDYSLKADSAAAPSYANKAITPTGALSLTSQVYIDSTAEDIDIFIVQTDSHVYTVFRQSGNNALCIYNGYSAGSSCSDNGILPDDTWLKLEFRLQSGIGDGSLKAFVDDVEVAGLTGNTGPDPYEQINLGNTLNRTGTFYYDDIEVTSLEESDDEQTSNSGSQDIFITKTNANGTYGWTKRIGGSGTDTVYDVAVDGEDSVYVVGAFTDTVDFEEDWDGTDEKESAGGTDGFVTKINASGDYEYTQRVGGEGADVMASIAVDDIGQLYIGGWFSDSVIFDEDTGLGSDNRLSEGGTDGFVLQLDEDGAWLQSVVFGGTTDDTVTAVAVLDEDDLAVAGDFTGTVDFEAFTIPGDGSFEYTSAGGTDVFLMRLGMNGAISSMKVFGGTSDEHVMDVAVAADGSVYLAGDFASSGMDFAEAWSGSPDTKVTFGGADGFLTMVENDDSYGWTRTIGGSGTDEITSVGLDSGSNIYIGGSFTSDSVNFRAGWGGTDNKSNAGSSTSDGFVTYLGANGSYGWTATIGANGDDAVLGLAVDGNDIAYAVGKFAGTVDFANDYSAGSDEKESAGNSDAFIMRTRDVPGTYKITDASGLTFEDENGVNLSSEGTGDPNPLVYILDDGDDTTLLATISADLTEDRDWSTAAGDSDLGEHKMFISGIVGAPGAVGPMTLYVPRESGDKAVTLCPGADALEEVTLTCDNAVTYTANDTGVAVEEIENALYWVISDVSDESIGGISRAFPGVTVGETDGSTAVTEAGLTDQVSVRLNAQPTHTVTVTLTPSVGGRIEVLDPLTFTESDWDEPQLVLLEPIDNDSIAGENSFTLSYATASSDPNYDETGEEDVVTVGWTDNDTADISWSGDSLTTESGDTAEICISLTSRPTHDVTLELESSDTGEVTLSDDSILIEPEDWDGEENCITAIGQDDDTTDGPQEVAISVTAVESDDPNFGNIDVGELEAFTVTNQDNDTASFTVTTSDPAETTEAGGTAEICVELSARPSSGSVTIPLTVSDPSEASLASSSLVIAAADWDADDNCVTITGEDDDIDDGDIQYTIQTGNPTAADTVWDELGADDIADPVFTNVDDDTAAITITESDGTTTVTEGGNTDIIDVVLETEPADSNEVVVSVQPNAQLSTGGGAGVATTLTFTAENWNTPQTVTVSANNDSSVEGDHTGSVTFSVHANTTEAPYESLPPEVVTVAITDNDIATASIAVADDTTEGSDDAGIFMVSLNSQNNTGGDIVINYSVDGTAVADTHYDALAGSVAIGNGQTEAEISVDVDEYDNELLEGNKTVIVTLTGSTSPSAVISETDDSALLVIFDDETATASLSTTQNGDEDGPVNIEYTVTLDKTNNTGEPITFTISPAGGTATVGSDYTNFAGSSISIPDGETTSTFTVTVTDDDLFEAATESVVAAISSPSLAAVSIDPEAAEASATIADDDVAVIGVIATDDTAAENPPSPGEFTISLNKVNNTGADITVEYEVGGTATPDEDYDELSGQAIIQNGQSSVKVTVDTEGYNDSSQEGNETVTLSNLTTNLDGRITVGDDSSATVTITDDEGANVVVSVPDDTTSEDGDTAQICFELTSEPSDNVTVALSSADSSKVSVPASVTILATDWDADDNCITATGHDDDPPVATGTQDVTIVTGDVTSNDAFYDGLTGGDVEDVTIHHADNDTAAIEVQMVDGDNQTSETGDTATVQFRLTSQPTSSVTIPLSVSDVTEGTLGEVSEIVIAAEDWDDFTANEVVVTGVDDYLTDGTINYLLVTGNPTSSDEIYDDLGADDVENPSLSNLDDDEPSVTIAATDGTTEVTEGDATDTQTVQIGTQPASGNEVVIIATPSNNQIDLGEGAGEPVELVFTNANWNEAQSVTIEAVDDSLLEANHSASVTYTIDTEQTTETAYAEYDEPLPTLGVSITDNDTATANLSTEDGSEEGPDDITFTITLSKTNNTGSPITFTLNPDGGTATVVEDYGDFTGTTVSVADGETTGVADVDIVDDSLLEGEETVIGEISDPSLGAVTIGTATDEATISDNDNTTVTITATDATAHENPSGNGEFTITLGKTNNTGDAITVDYSVTGTATPDEDYAALSGTASIASGQSTTTITVNTSGYNDDSVEGSETVIVTLNATNHQLVTVGNPDNATVTIIDDDTPSVTITATDGTTVVSEDGTTDEQTIEIGTQPAEGTKVVIVATPENNQLDLGAGPGNSVERTFTDENWNEAQTVTVSAVDDSLLEADHSADITYTIDLDETDDPDYLNYEEPLPILSVSIADNDTATADLSAADGDETGPSDIEYTVTLSKTNNTGAPITVTLNPSGGTATVTADYANFALTTVSIANGATTGTANVAVVDDSLLEGDETVQGTISDPSLGVVTIGAASATATITDDDTAAATIIATDAAAHENPSDNGTFTVYLDKVNHTGGVIIVDYSVSGTATAGEDYQALSGSVSIGNGESTATITVNTSGFDDDTVEDNETVIVTLDGASHQLVSVGSPGQATVTIADDDSFAMNLTTTTNGDENGPVDIIYTVTLNHVNDTGSAITATISDSGNGTASSGDDYEAFGGTVSIADGQQSTTYTVAVKDDDDLEGTESVEAVLSNPSEGAIGIASATATIADDDTATATIIASDALATENPSDNGAFEIILSKPNMRGVPIEFTYSINGTATGGQDYEALSGHAMIASGQSKTTIIVNTNGYDDALFEGDETVVITLTGANIGVVTIGSPNQATVTIADDDPQPSSGSSTPRQRTPPSSTTVYVPAAPELIVETPVESPVEQQPQPADQVKQDLDGDGVPDEEEQKAHNRGDGNGDGIPDTKQANVASVISAVTKQPVTLEVWGECTTIKKFAVVPEQKLDKQDKRFRYPYGLVDYTLSCDEAGQNAHVTIYYNKQYDDIARWRKFNPSSEQFTELASLQQLAQPIGNRDVSTVQYSLRDGGDNDDDGKRNGTIIDPAGPAIRTFYFWDVGWILPVLLGGYFIGRSFHHRFRDHGMYHRITRV